MALLMGAYSFLDNILSISGPGGSFVIAGPDTAAADEGFTIEMLDASNEQTPGADGSTMNSFIASRRARLTLRLQKVSPVNAQLNALYQYQRQSSIYWGLNVLTHRGVVSGDSNTMEGCAFTRHSRLGYTARGDNNEWEFDVAIWDPTLGAGVATVAA